MKKLLVLGDYFYPDYASTGQLLTELCECIQNEYDITVLTSVPRENIEQYKQPINEETYKKIKIVRVRTKPFNKTNKFSRIKHIIEYYRLIKKAIKQIDKQDIVFTISQPPLLGGFLGKYAKKIHNARFIYNIQDFNPEQANAVGYLKSKYLLKILKWLDNKSLKFADRIILVGNDMKETIKNRKVDTKDKIQVINNWIDEEKVYPLYNEDVIKFKEENGLNNKIVIMYSGNIGLYYDLENIVKVMARFKDNKEVVFAFVGDGSKKNEIEQWVKDNNISNIKFIPYQKKEDILYSLNATDIHLVTNQKGIKGVSVPSKIYGVMAVGKYVIGILEDGSEASNLIKESGCGTVVQPSRYDDIYNIINDILRQGKQNLSVIGLKGRQYLEKNYKKRYAIYKYRKVFDEL